MPAQMKRHRQVGQPLQEALHLYRLYQVALAPHPVHVEDSLSRAHPRDHDDLHGRLLPRDRLMLPQLLQCT